VDFILAHWHDAQFPAFNVADSAITVGAALMLLDAFSDGRRSSN
jgi:signal peptidase II